MKTVYLDYNATTPVDPEVAAAMRPYLEGYFGNPSSAHRFGTEARQAVEKAREQVAALINAQPDEIIFTSGGTESNNMAIKGIAFRESSRGKHIITSSIEHPAVLEVCRYLGKQGFEVSYIDPDETGRIHPEDIENAIRPDTILLSLMHANNEVGSIQPLEEVGKLAAQHGIVFHSDAAQSAGKIPVDVEKTGVHLLSLAGHKMYGPKGVGALYIRRGTGLEKLIHGADHEQNLRAGTENVLEIVGFGQACETAGKSLRNEMLRLKALRERLFEGITKNLEGIKRNGHPEYCLPNTLSLSFAGLDAASLIAGMPGIAVSAGAACHTGEESVSHVLRAMNVPQEYQRGTLRLSLGKPTTEEEIDTAVDTITGLVGKLRKDIPYLPDPLETQRPELTAYTQGLGCACKLRPQELEKLLRQFTPSSDPRVLVDQSTSDDAAVFLSGNGNALVQTLDFFTPVVNDPYQFGAIAAANALSDIYAMGASPLFALNMVAFPSSRLPLEVLGTIIKGATDKCREAGIEILGGHSIEDTELKFGLSVTGTVHPSRILRNSGARPGDAILLTKPLGTGVISTAIKKKAATSEMEQAAISVMLELNREAAEILGDFSVTACTDVTGFGLLGHLYELTRASLVNAEVWNEAVPLIQGAGELARAGYIPGGSRNNFNYLGPHVDFDSRIPRHEQLLLCDAQTSGGLLFTIPAEELEQLHGAFTGSGVSPVVQIGRITHSGEGNIRVVSKKAEE